jgi:hypothetical protein
MLVELTASLKVGAQLVYVQVAGARVNIYEFRNSPGLGYGFRRGDEAVGYSDNRVASAHTCREQREAQGIGAAAHGHAVPGAAKRRPSGLKLQHQGAIGKCGCA